MSAAGCAQGGDDGQRLFIRDHDCVSIDCDSGREGLFDPDGRYLLPDAEDVKAVQIQPAGGDHEPRLPALSD